MSQRRRTPVRVFVLLILATAGLLLAACGGDSAEDAGPVATYTPDTEMELFTLNVDVSDSSYDPVNVSVPAGRSIQLILRNRSSIEHHYRVVDLEPTEMLWLAQPEEMVREEGVTEEDHELHHEKGFVDFRGTSPSGVKPTLTEVHAYAIGGAVDVVHFYALTPGVYEVSDPLHPELQGKFTVFAP